MSIENRIIRQFRENKISEEAMTTIINERDALMARIDQEEDLRVRADLIERKDELLRKIATAYLPLFISLAHEIGEKYSIPLAERSEWLSRGYEYLLRSAINFKLGGKTFASYAAWSLRSRITEMATDYLERSTREQSLSSKNDNGTSILDFIGDNEVVNPEQAAIDGELISRFSEALNTLTPKELEVITKRYLIREPLTQKEIADGRRQKTTATAIGGTERRALRRMREYLNKGE